MGRALNLDCAPGIGALDEADVELTAEYAVRIFGDRALKYSDEVSARLGNSHFAEAVKDAIRRRVYGIVQ